MSRPLPDGWTWARFSDVATVAANLVDPADYGNLPHVAPNHIESRTGRLLEHTTVAADGVISSKHLFRPGQILYSKIRPYLAKATLAPTAGLCSADMYPIETELEPAFLLRWLLSDEFTQLACAQQGRSLLPKINQKQLAKLPVPVPSHVEQVRIATTLDVAMAQLDGARASTAVLGRRLATAREDILRRACLGQLVAQDLSEQPPAALADMRDAAQDTPNEALPRLPKNWTWTTLATVAEVVGGVTKDGKKQDLPGLVEVPYLRVANVHRNELRLDDVARIRVTPAKLEALRLQPGDVLMNEGGDRDKLGRGWVWEGQLPDCVHQNHVFRARVRDGVLHPRLLSWHGNTFGQRWFESVGKQTTNLASLSLTNVRRLPVPVPPAQEQLRIVDEVERRLSILDAVDAGLARVAARSDALRRTLLRAAFAGTLVRSVPTQETGEALVERIRGARAQRPSVGRATARTVRNIATAPAVATLEETA